MMELGFAVENVIFGAGSYSFQYNTRDTQGWAYKATYAEINGKPIMVYKDPKTSDGTKKSQKGMVRVYRDADENIKFIDSIFRVNSIADEPSGMLETVFKDGKIVKECSLAEVRDRLYGGKF